SLLAQGGLGRAWVGRLPGPHPRDRLDPCERSGACFGAGATPQALRRGAGELASWRRRRPRSSAEASAATAIVGTARRPTSHRRPRGATPTGQARYDRPASGHGAAQVRSRACLGRGCDHDFVGESFGAFDMGEGLEGLGVAVALSNALILAALIMAASGAAGVLLGCVFSGLSAVRGLGVGLAGGALFLTQMARV
ncbi:unnamed protein product, partial [Prorocentrum cordatum]